jgi:hypothetical protein
MNRRTGMMIGGAVVLLIVVILVSRKSGNVLRTDQPGAGKTPSISIKTDDAKLSQYIGSLYLGKLPAGTTVLPPAGTVERATVFAPGKSICIVTDFKATVPKGAYAEAIYDLGAQKIVGDKAVNGGLALSGSIRKCNQYGLPVGQYAFEVYINDVLAGAFPFQIEK